MLNINRKHILSLGLIGLGLTLSNCKADEDDTDEGEEEVTEETTEATPTTEPTKTTGLTTVTETDTGVLDTGVPTE